MTTTTTTYTEEQLAAIESMIEAGDALDAAGAVAILTEEGHPAFGPIPQMQMVAAGAKVAGEGELVVVEGKQLPAADEEPFDDGLMAGAEDLIIPRLKIRQALTKFDGGAKVPEGALFLSVDPAGYTETRRFVILRNTLGRTFSIPMDKGKADTVLSELASKHDFDVPDGHKGPACFSTDRVTPEDQGFSALSPKHKGVLSTQCKGCKHAQWRTIRGGGRVQACGEDYTFYILDVTEIDGGPLDQPSILVTNKSAIPATKNLLSNLKMVCRRAKRQTWGFVVEMTTEAKPGKGDQGDYYVPVFGKPEPVSDALFAECAAVRESCGWGKQA